MNNYENDPQNILDIQIKRDSAFDQLTRRVKKYLPSTLLQACFLFDDPANQNSGVVAALVIGAHSEKLIFPVGIITPEGEPISHFNPIPLDSV